MQIVLGWMCTLPLLNPTYTDWIICFSSKVFLKCNTGQSTSEKWVCLCWWENIQYGYLQPSPPSSNMTPRPCAPSHLDSLWQESWPNGATGYSFGATPSLLAPVPGFSGTPFMDSFTDLGGSSSDRAPCWSACSSDIAHLAHASQDFFIIWNMTNDSRKLLFPISFLEGIFAYYYPF